MSRKTPSLTVLFNVFVLVAMVVVTGAVAAPPATAAGPDPATGEVRVVASDEQGMKLAFRAPAFDLIDPGISVGGLSSCETVSAKGLVLSQEASRPQLPVKVALVGVPAGARLLLDIDAGTPRQVASGITLCPTVPPVRENQADDAAPAVEPFALDPQVYGQDAPYPAQTVRLIDLGFMRSQRIVRLEVFPFQYNPVSKKLVLSEDIQIGIRFAGAAPAESEALSEPPAFEAALKRSLLNYETARAWRSPAAQPTVAAASPAFDWTPPQPGYKVAVKDEGLYQITAAALAAAGVPVSQVDPRTIRIYNATAPGSHEVAIEVTGETDGKFDEGDLVLFFGQGVDTRYTDKNVYWLTYGGSAGLRVAARASTAGGVLAGPYVASVKKETDSVYDSDLPKLPGYDHWFGQQITAAGAGKTGFVNISVETPQLASGSLTAGLKMLLGAVTAGTHHVRLYVNPTSNPAAVWDGTWDGQTVSEISASFPQTDLLPSGSNTIKIEVVNDFEGRAADIIRVDWVETKYRRAYVVDNGRLLFGVDASGALRYEVAGFTATDVDLYDVTDPSRTVRITGGSFAASKQSLYLPLTLKGSMAARANDAGASNPGSALGVAAGAEASAAAVSGPQDRFRFGDNRPTPARYLALEAAHRLTPLSISPDQASNLHDTSQGADYIIITHADFAAAIAPLASYRSGQGQRVKVVDVQDVYDEFGGGLMSAEAIRDFIAYAYSNWVKPAPSRVLLVGDGNYDFRGYKSTATNFVPPFLEMVDPDAGETATDNRFVAVTPGDILPDLDIGRLPANTSAEATVMVNKVLAYETQESAPWQKQVLFVADDLEGGGGNFYQYSDGIADGTTTYKGSEVKILPAGYTPSKVYLGQTCDLANPSTSVECRDQVVSKINSGALLVSYIGHGVKTYWAAEHLYDATAVASLTNTGRLPIMLPMTCNEGYFIDPAEPSLSETSIRMPLTGSVATWAPTGFGLAPGHDYLERGLFLSVFYDKASLGAGATAAKLYLVANVPPGSYADLIDTFLLLGDPALRVK